MSKIVVLGAAGRLGGAAAKAFVKAGWTVSGVARGAKLKALPIGVEPIEADAMDEAALIAACEGADIILHAINPPYDKWPETVVPIARNVIAAAKATSATVMFPGNIYNYGTGLALDMDESHAGRTDVEKGNIRIAMEGLFEKAAKESGLRTIIIRAGDFFGGPAGGSWIDLMILKDAAKNKFVWPGPWDAIHAFAYVNDLADAFVRVAEKRDELDPFTTLHFRGYAITGNQMHRAAEEALGRSLSRGGAPWTMMKIGGLFNPMVREVIKMRYLWNIPHSLDNSRLEALIGQEPMTPLQDALKQSVEDLKLLG